MITPTPTKRKDSQNVNTSNKKGEKSGSQDPKRSEGRICKRQELRPQLIKKKKKIVIDCSEMAKEALDSNNFNISDFVSDWFYIFMIL